MDSIKKWKDYIQLLYPVRRNDVQKAAFRKWLMGELKHSGWRAREETYGKLNGSVNVIAGDPERAQVFLCTHYDTAARALVPDFVSPTNVAAHVIYHTMAAVLLLAAAFLLSLAVSFPLRMPELMLPLFLLLAVALLGFSAFGPANPNNANSSTSGVLALLASAKELAFDRRVCLVFLDNNERNLLGASAFKKAHPDRAAGNLFIDLDCVGDGDCLLLLPSKYSRWDGDLLAALEAAFPAGEEMTPVLRAKGLHYYPSDNRRFKFHVAVCACRFLAGLGYYIPRLHTRRDTVLSEENAAYVARSVARFVPLYLDGGDPT